MRGILQMEGLYESRGKINFHCSNFLTIKDGEFPPDFFHPPRGISAIKLLWSWHENVKLQLISMRNRRFKSVSLKNLKSNLQVLI